jgi:hypothetical protein
VRQNERDYKSLGDAVTSGRITAEPGMSAAVDAGRLCLLRADDLSGRAHHVPVPAVIVVALAGATAP